MSRRGNLFGIEYDKSQKERPLNIRSVDKVKDFHKKWFYLFGLFNYLSIAIIFMIYQSSIPIPSQINMQQPILSNIPISSYPNTLSLSENLLMN